MDDLVMLEPLAQKQARLALIHAGETTLKLRFVKDPALTIDENTPRSALVAAECDAVDYTAGGYTITYATGGVTADKVAYNVSGLMGFVVADASIPQSVQGCWIDNGTDAFQRVAFDEPVPLDAVGKSIHAVVYDGYPPGRVGVELVQP